MPRGGLHAEGRTPDSAMARQHLLLAAAALLAVAAQAHLASEWPKQPLGAPIELRADAANEVLLDSARRELADKVRAARLPPSCLRTARPTGAERAARAHRQSTAASAPPPASPRRCSAWRAAQAAAGKPESYEIFHIILWSSIGIALALFFAVLALVNMDVGNDSMLYSKARPPPGRCPLEASPLRRPGSLRPVAHPTGCRAQAKTD